MCAAPAIPPAPGPSRDEETAGEAPEDFLTLPAYEQLAQGLVEGACAGHRDGSPRGRAPDGPES